MVGDRRILAGRMEDALGGDDVVHGFNLQQKGEARRSPTRLESGRP
jgi:hypothetical protein